MASSFVSSLPAQSIDPKEAHALLAARSAELREKLPPPDSASPTQAANHRALLAASGVSTGEGDLRHRHKCECPTHQGNPLSSLLVREENPEAARLDGFTLRDDQGRRTRPWKARTREECRRRGAVVQRPLLVFLETPPEQEDFDQPWFGPVRFDRPNFFTTKERITEQIFGKDFDFRDPSSVAGFFYRESGGQLIIKGDASSVHTVTVPFMDFHADALSAAILAQLDPLVDFTQRSDEFGWAHPIIIITPFSTVFDFADSSLMGIGPSVIGFSTPLFFNAPALTNDAFPDGTHAALSTIALNNVALTWGWNHVPGEPEFGLPDDLFATDRLEYYAHEYGHAIGLNHMFSSDYALPRFDPPDPSLPFARFDPPGAFTRDGGSGFGTSVMNYNLGTGYSLHLLPGAEEWIAGLDPISRTKLGWGNVTEISLTEQRRAGPDELSPGDRRRVELVEHLGGSVRDRRPQILKVNLPPQEVAFYPHLDGAGNPTGYWRPGSGKNRRMAWSGTTMLGSRMMETTLRIPSSLDAPVLSFWTKYGSHSGYLRGPGIAFGWVQISTDDGATWTSLPGETSSTFVGAGVQDRDYFGDDLGAPAFTGDSRQHAADGWIFERVPLPVAPGAVCRIRFNHSGAGWVNTFTPQDIGWWIDDVHLGTAADPRRHLISDFEGRDVERWKGLLTEFDQGFGFVVVEEKVDFPQAYLFELRGHNAHDEIAYQQIHPRPQSAGPELAFYAYEPGVTGYYTNHYASYWALPFRWAGTATGHAAPLDRLQRLSWDYPFSPQASQDGYSNFTFLLSVALDSNNPFGFTLADLAFGVTYPVEAYSATAVALGQIQIMQSEFPFPGPVTMLDAAPTYRPLDVRPSVPALLVPELGFSFSPEVGATGGWPKSILHGPLGQNDPTTKHAIGQPFLLRDGAFHPKRNPRFDDRIDYHQQFANEFRAWHADSTVAALGSATMSERYGYVPNGMVPVSATEFIPRYRLAFVPQDAAGNAVPKAQAAQRPWIEQLMYERFVSMIFQTLIASCIAQQPTTFTLETKPAWETYYACVFAKADEAHQLANTMLELARQLGDNPDYAALNAFGDQGTLSPGLWSAFYLEAWARAKGPPPQPSYGLTVEVEHITKGHTPTAVLELRRAGKK